MYLGQEQLDQAGGNHLDNSYHQANNKASLGGPDPARPEAGHGIRPAQGGARSSALGNIATEVHPPPAPSTLENQLSLRKDSYRYKYGYYGLMLRYERDIEAELKAIQAGISEICESSPEAAVEAPRRLHEASGGVTLPGGGAKSSAMLQGLTERLQDLADEHNLVNHRSRWCKRRPVPATITDKYGHIRATGMPGHPQIHQYETPEKKWGGLAGLQQCSSPFFCLSCANQIYSKRRKEIEQLFSHVQAKGHSLIFATFTHPHTNKQTITEIMPVLLKMRKELRKGMPWQRFKSKYGLYGSVVALEVTWSRLAGFHPHFHICWVSSQPGFSPAEAEEIEQWFAGKWSQLAVKHGLVTDELKRQQHLDRGVRVEIGTDKKQAEYLTKFQAWEMASTTTKEGRKADSLTPWDISFIAQGQKPRRAEWKPEVKLSQAEAKVLWFDFLRGMKRRSAVQWSQGLKALVGVAEVDDKTIVEGNVGEKVYDISNSDYAKMWRERTIVQVLEAVEDEFDGGPSAKERVEREYGIKLSEEEDMKQHQIDMAIATLQEEIDWIEECGVMQDIPLARKMEMIRRRQELQADIEMLLEGKAMMQ